MELSELRKLLCLKQSDVADIERATKGRIFRTAVADALGAGIDSFTGVSQGKRIAASIVSFVALPVVLAHLLQFPDEGAVV